MHKDVRKRRIPGTGVSGKAVVFGVLERGKEVRTYAVVDRKAGTVVPIIQNEVAPGATIFSDEYVGYQGLQKEYAHEVVNHMESYVNGRVHVNGMENFWSLLKRGLNGTYVNVEPFHLFRYLDEQTFRYNNRKNDLGNKVSDAERFKMALSQIAGKRLTFKEVTGKVGETPF
jgi:transposase-like protein